VHCRHREGVDEFGPEMIGDRPADDSPDIRVIATGPDASGARERERGLLGIRGGGPSVAHR
jgi:hypothetical protein